MKTENEWKAWIHEFCATTIRTYRNEPERVREDFGSENRVKDDYKGRVLLELLQNADDAQIPNSDNDQRIDGKEVTFFLTPDTFYCANGGYPLQSEGLNAICRLSHSPKKNNEHFIGEKGLGFKSVLSFTSTPEIHGQGLHVRFNRDESLTYFKNANLDPELVSRTGYDIALFRFPIHMDSSQWSEDTNLMSLLEYNATIIKMPLQKVSYEILLDKLTQLEASVLLFVNHLERITIQILQPDSTVTKNTFEIDRTDKNGFILREGEDVETKWHLFSKVIPVDDKFKGEMNDDTFQQVTACRISYALIKNEKDQYVPVFLNEASGNFIRVYFPTEEPFPLPFIYHANYYTDSSRKTINMEHEYNQNVTEAAVNFFIQEILPRILMIDNEDPCAHMDLLVPFLTSKNNSVGGQFLKLFYELLGKKEIVPGSNGKLRKASESKILPVRPDAWAQWYQYLDTNSLDLVNLSMMRSNRVKVAKDLGMSELDKLELLDAVHIHEGKDLDYYAVLLKLINQLAFLCDDFDRKKSLKEKCKSMKILLTSENNLTSSEELPVYMNPVKDDLIFPDWLEIKFVHPELVAKLGTSKERVHIEYLEIFGVKLFAARDVVRDLSSRHLRNYWSKVTTFHEIDLLRFLFQILDYSKDEWKRPDQSLYNLLKDVPVPVGHKGKVYWVQAGKCYFGSDWTQNDLLEMLYKDTGLFLIYPSFFQEEGFAKERLMSFFYYIGVENKPRVLEIGKKELLESIAGKEYWKAVTTQNKHLVKDDTSYWNTRFDVKEAYTLDNLEAILLDDHKSKVLLNFLALNPTYYHSFPLDILSYNPKRSPYWYSFKPEPSYLKWIFRHADWLRDTNNIRYKPDSIYFIDTFTSKQLAEFVPQVQYRVGPSSARRDVIKIFLLHLGVKDNLELLSYNQWHGIMSKLAEKYVEGVQVSEEEADKIRILYRAFIRSLVNNTDSEDVNGKEVMRTTKVLAFHQNKYSFFSLEDVIYADKPTSLQEWQTYVPCFHTEFSRASRVKDLFGIPSLSESIFEKLAVGEEDKLLTDMMNSFLHDAKPYLLARIHKQRMIRNDMVNLLKNVRIIPVKEIQVTKYLRWPNGSEVPIPKRSVESAIDKDSTNGTVIYIRSGMLWSSDYADMYRNDKVLAQIVIRLCELLDIDLREAFQLILSRNVKSRITLLNHNDIDDETILECKELLNFPNEEGEVLDTEPVGSISVPEIVQVDNGKQKDDETSDKPQSESPLPPVQPTYEVPVQKPARLPEFDPSRTIFIEEEQNGTENESVREPHMFSTEGKGKDEGRKGGGDTGGKSGGSGGGTGRIEDSELRRLVEKRSMDIVMSYERDCGRVPDDSPSKARRSKMSLGPGCDIYSTCSDGTIRQIEVKASLSDLETIDMTQAELDRARAFGSNYYIYRVHKLDPLKYPEGPEILIYKDPYHQTSEIQAVIVRVSLDRMKHVKVQVKQTANTQDVKEIS